MEPSIIVLLDASKKLRANIVLHNAHQPLDHSWEDFCDIIDEFYYDQEERILGDMLSDLSKSRETMKYNALFAAKKALKQKRDRV